MTTLIIGGILVVLALFIFAIFLDELLNKNDDFISVKEWHNFRNSFDKSKGGK